MSQATTHTATDLVLCQSADGWSLHAPGSTDDQIATGDAPYLVSGAGEPTDADYAAAQMIVDRTRIEAGDGDDHDYGRILSVSGGMAMVAWETGVRTRCPMTDIRAA